MARYLIETDAGLPIGADAAELVRTIGDFGATWTHAYVSEDGGSAFCIIEGPDPETVRRAALKGGWRVIRLLRVAIFDPHA